MSGHDFVIAPGGWIAPLSEAKRKEIKKQFPGVAADNVEREAGAYVLWRDAIEKSPSPGEARQTLNSLRAQVEHLRAAIEPVAHGPLGRFVRAGSFPIVGGNALNELGPALQRAGAALASASTKIPSGRARAARHRLTIALAQIVAEAGLVVDARPQGPLCRLVGIVLEAAGEQPSDVRRIVKPIAAKWKKPPAAVG